MIKELKKMIIFYSSPFVRLVLTLGVFLFLFSFCMILFSNPFSKYNHEDPIRDLCLTPSIDDIEFSGKPIGNKIISISSKIYMYNNQYYNIIETDDFGKSSIVIIEPSEYLGEGMKESVEISHLKDCKPHPLPLFSSSDSGDLLILGTTSSGFDYFSLLIFSLKKTLILSMFALISFLLFGISLGIFLGYYKNRFRKSFLIIDYIQKMIESVPIILWMIISYAFLDSELPLYLIPWQKEIIFFLFGIFSSTALSKLLVNKFENFRKEDFIVALKLLGIKDRRIIFVHIIKYYCMPLIIMQMVYIIAQCFFMDITLAVLQFGEQGTLGQMFSSFLSNASDWGTTHIIILSGFIYMILSTLFYSSEYLKVVSSHE